MGVEDLYYQKYLKYKNKYLNLQSQIAGGDGPIRQLMKLLPKTRAQAEAQRQAEEAQREAEEIAKLTKMRNENIVDFEKLLDHLILDEDIDQYLDLMRIFIKIEVKMLFNNQKKTDPTINLEGSTNDDILGFTDTEINKYLLEKKINIDLRKKIENLKLELSNIRTSKVQPDTLKKLKIEKVIKLKKLEFELYNLYKDILFELNPLLYNDLIRIK